VRWLPPNRSLERSAVACWLTALALAAATLASTASADTGVIPDTRDLPWSDPNHETPLEELASQVASSIAGRPVRVHCNGPTDWDALAREEGFAGEEWWGYVDAPGFWDPAFGTWTESSTRAQLGPIACERLWRFAKTTTKPTKCAASRTLLETKQVTVRYRATVRVSVRTRVRLKGKWVVRRVPAKRRVWRTRSESRGVTRTIRLEARPCTGPREPDVTVAPPAEGWTAYAEYVFALQTLAHESIHLFDFTSGRTVPASTHEMESRAECLGMQTLPRVAVALGASPDDASSIAAWYATNVYPSRETETPDYWSVDCRAGGPLDLSPADGQWP
jgi:hypothetical protein